MQITTYVEELQRQLLTAASAGTPDTEETAGRLAAALDAAVRLAIMEALSDAAGEITRELAPGSVDVRLRGREVDFVVSKPAAEGAASAPSVAPPHTPAPAEDADDAATSRTTLRLPDTLKALAEAAAALEGVSLNSWLVKAVTAALEPGPAVTRPSRGNGYTGWVR